MNIFNSTEERDAFIEGVKIGMALSDGGCEVEQPKKKDKRGAYGNKPSKFTDFTGRRYMKSGRVSPTTGKAIYEMTDEYKEYMEAMGGNVSKNADPVRSEAAKRAWKTKRSKAKSEKDKYEGLANLNQPLNIKQEEDEQRDND